MSLGPWRISLQRFSPLRVHVQSVFPCDPSTRTSFQWLWFQRIELVDGFAPKAKKSAAIFLGFSEFLAPSHSWIYSISRSDGKPTFKGNRKDIFRDNGYGRKFQAQEKRQETNQKALLETANYHARFMVVPNENEDLRTIGTFSEMLKIVEDFGREAETGDHIFLFK